MAHASRLPRTHLPCHIHTRIFVHKSTHTFTYCSLCFYFPLPFEFVYNLFFFVTHTHTPALIDTRASVSKELCVPCSPTISAEHVCCALTVTPLNKFCSYHNIFLYILVNAVSAYLQLRLIFESTVKTQFTDSFILLFLYLIYYVLCTRWKYL